ncbi:MAG: lipid-A-disaccharide synthase [Saprospiraceae bacterium]|jgi:lipid-A-disaccharide synthase
MKYYLIAGENSGDLHGSKLMRELSTLDSQAEFRFCGGDLMLNQSKNICTHVKDMSFMGFIEVLMNIRTIKANINKVRHDIKRVNPDALILIDYPGFNLRMAKFAHDRGIKVYYYISPKVWAWKASRIKKIKAWVNKLYLILPFEEAFFANYNYKAKYVGNPLLDAIEDFNKAKQTPIESAKHILALLPGSRKMEVSKILPVMLDAAKQMEGLKVIVAGVRSLPKTFYQGAIDAGIEVLYDNTYQLLSQAHLAIVTSGTATLETALFNVPQVVCYKAHPLTIAIAKAFIKIKFISLVNLIMDKEVVKELIQEEFNTNEVLKQLQPLNEGAERQKMLADYAKLQQIMGLPGASKRVAQEIHEDVKA